MNGIIRNITPSGDFVAFVIELENGETVQTYTGPKFRNYACWRQFLIGDSIGGLRRLKKKPDIIDADSPVFPIQFSQSRLF